MNSSRNSKPKLGLYFDSRELDQRVIYTLSLKVITNTYLRSFHYKMLITYLNEKMFAFGLSTTSVCSFCNYFGINITHLFCNCIIIQCLWKKLQLKLKNNITVLLLTPQATIFSFLEADIQYFLIENYILVILELYIFKSRKGNFLTSTWLSKEIREN